MSKFVFLLSVLCTVSVVLCTEDEEAHEILVKCAKEVNIPVEILESSAEPDFENPKIKCFVACVLKNSPDTLMVDGRIAVDREKITEGDVDKILECISRANHKLDECERAAYFYTHCWDEPASSMSSEIFV